MHAQNNLPPQGHLQECQTQHPKGILWQFQVVLH